MLPCCCYQLQEGQTNQHSGLLAISPDCMACTLQQQFPSINASLLEEGLSLFWKLLCYYFYNGWSVYVWGGERERECVTQMSIWCICFGLNPFSRMKTWLLLCLNPAGDYSKTSGLMSAVVQWSSFKQSVLF